MITPPPLFFPFPKTAPHPEADGDDVDRDVAKYLEGMRIWTRANYDRSKVTPRYESPEASMEGCA